VERQAFARVRKLFLNNRPLAKWTALAAAVATGVLYVAFLFLLGLFADLLVNRGQIPAYWNLSAPKRDRFQQRWGEALDAPQRTQMLTDIGVPPSAAAKLAEDFHFLRFRDQALCWHADIYQLLEARVGPVAAALTLPDYRELPSSVHEVFLHDWQALDEPGKRQYLDLLGADAERLLKAEPAQLTFDDQARLWRAHLYFLVRERSQSVAVADAFWRDRTGGVDDADWSPGHELSDRGILAAVVRGREGAHGRLLAWLARWNPWMWRWGSASRPNYSVYLAGLLFAALVLALVRWVAMYVSNYAAARAVIDASSRLRRAVYHHTYRLGRLAFRALGPSEAVGIFTRQVETLHNGLYAALTVLVREPIKFALLLAFALVVNFWLALAFLLFALLVWIVGGQIAVYFRQQERVAIRQAGDQIALLQESLMIMRLVKCFLMELFNQARVERQLSKYAAAQLRRYRGEALYRPLLIFLGTLAAVVLLYVAGLIVLSGRLGVASGIALATALVSLYLPLVNWLAQRRLLRKAREAATIVFKFLDRPGEVGQAVGAEFLPPLGQRLEFDNVTLHEPGTGRKLLQAVSLTIPAGQRIGLVGPDEMQKHALVYLIPRFLDPTGGEIRVDGHNIRWVTIDSLRAQIAMVMQHNLVFNDTVSNNIGCGDPGFDLPKTIEAAKIAHAHHFIQKLPKGYETPVGELGHTLNVSEQFRIALARAILRDPALLVIEEPVSPLDEDTKALFDDTLMRVLAGRTVIFLPHRISTIRGCDQVFLLHKGRVEAAGEHRELLAHNDLYKHLHYLEFNEFAEQV
jgi:ATP-binding cassette subfamily B protein